MSAEYTVTLVDANSFKTPWDKDFLFRHTPSNHEETVYTWEMSEDEDLEAKWVCNPGGVSGECRVFKCAPTHDIKSYLNARLGKGHVLSYVRYAWVKDYLIIERQAWSDEDALEFRLRFL